MDRFLLAENPIKNPNSNQYDPLYIIHTLEPKCIIEAVCLNDIDSIDKTVLPSMTFNHLNSDGINEEWRLIVRDQYSTLNYDELQKLLPRAWRWYRSYLEWEDKNIDIQEEGKWN